MTTLDEMIASLPLERQRRIEALAEEAQAEQREWRRQEALRARNPVVQAPPKAAERGGLTKHPSPVPRTPRLAVDKVPNTSEAQ